MATNEKAEHDPSAAELEQRIQATQASLTAKLTALTDELRQVGRESTLRLTEKLELGIDRVATKAERGVAQVTGTLGHLAEHVEHVMANAKHTLDLRAQVRSRPLTAVAAAAVVGLLWSRRESRAEGMPSLTRAARPAPSALAQAGAWLRPVLETLAMALINNAAERMLERRVHHGHATAEDSFAADADLSSGLPH